MLKAEENGRREIEWIISARMAERQRVASMLRHLIRSVVLALQRDATTAPRLVAHCNEINGPVRTS